jgi:hypothetical protein
MSQIYAAIRKKKLKATPGLILIAEKDEATKEILKSRGVAFKLRQERNSNRLPNAHNDLSLRYQ